MAEWIKCSEKMPEKDGRYLVYVDYKHHHWIGVSSLRKGIFDDPTAIYWQELPTNPEDE